MMTGPYLIAAGPKSVTVKLPNRRNLRVMTQTVDGRVSDKLTLFDAGTWTIPAEQDAASVRYVVVLDTGPS
jgi:hypothetical protein